MYYCWRKLRYTSNLNPKKELNEVHGDPGVQSLEENANLVR
jgi:hypothetical protein